jgi:hypothetical protein
MEFENDYNNSTHNYSNNTHMRGKKVPRKRKRRGETRIMIEFGDNLSFMTYLFRARMS